MALSSSRGAPNELNVKESLSSGFEEFKKTEKDFSALVQATYAYRTATLAAYDSSIKMIAELKKMSEHDSNLPYAKVFSIIAADYENSEKKRYEFQAKMWDNFILPMMSAQDVDMKEMQDLEKKLKNTNQKLDSQLKSQKRTLVKVAKKRGDSSPEATQLQSSIDDIRRKQEAILDYFQKWKEGKYHKWTTGLSNSVVAEQEYHQITATTLGKADWTPHLTGEPPSLPFVEFKEAPAPPPAPNKPAEVQTVVASADTLKFGYLDKKGQNRRNWTRRWFVLSKEKLQYYKTANSVGKEPPKGEIRISECQTCEIPSDYNKRRNCFILKTPTRVYFFNSDSNDDMQSWIEALRQVLPVQHTTHHSMSFLNEYDTKDDVDQQWQQYYTDEGYEYWYNESTGETSWERPPNY